MPRCKSWLPKDLEDDIREEVGVRAGVGEELCLSGMGFPELGLPLLHHRREETGGVGASQKGRLGMTIRLAQERHTSRDVSG